MELKLGVSSFWILFNIIMMMKAIAAQREKPKCQSFMKPDNFMPDRCLDEGGARTNYYYGFRCSYEDWTSAYHGKQCCFQQDTNNPYKAYRFHVYDVEKGGVPPYYPQNILHYLDSTLAQEGRSFCLVGEHFYQTQLIHWKNFKMFKPLAERFFDIGNHIHPLDSRLMNTFVPFDTDRLFGRRKHGFRNVLTTPNLKADFKQVYCGTRTHPHGVDHHIYGSRWNYCDGEFSSDTLDDVNPNKHHHRPAIPEEAMDPICRNPYKVKVTRIEVDELQMKNYLHIKVYADATTTGRKCPTGKMKYLMLEVRDQDGFPVGQFTNEIPCDTEHNKETPSCPPSTRPCAPLYGSKKNFMPCMFSHHLASEAPMIFLAGVESSSASAGNSSGGGSPGGGGPDGGDGGSSYFTEVHTTWRFAQMSSHLITELHFATMIVEDETPIRYYTSRMTEWDGVYKCGFFPYRNHYFQPGHAAYCCNLVTGGCVNRMIGWVSSQHGSFKSGGNTFSFDPNPYYHCGLTQFCSMNYHVNGTNNTDRPYGFSAQYNVIKLKKGSLGGWDYFRKGFIRDRDINCHKDIPEIDPYFELVSSYPHGNPYARLPPRRKMFLDERYRDIDGGKGELEDIMTPGRNAWTTLNSNKDCTNGKYRKNWNYIGRSPEDVMKRALKDVWNDPVVVQTYYAVDPKITEYFGTKYTKQSDPSSGSPIPAGFREELTLSLKQMVEQDKARCPCPFVPTTEAPEIQTKAPVEINARHLHVVNMLIAWVVLVPLGYFVARYYKETFSKVFFLQEFWWYTIHVLALLTALLFMAGSFYAMYLRREGTDYKILWTDATMIHIYFGYSIVAVFVIHVLLGAFRAWDVYFRDIQIWLHWGVGWAQYLLAAVTIISAAGIPQGLMNCVSLYIYASFLIVQFIFYVVMENHIRNVDNHLDLSPPRQYFPVPMMRIFHKDAPGALFRIWVLLAYFLISIGFYAALHFTTNLEPGSCFQKTK